MQDAILYINEVGKRKDKPKIKKTFPTIRRTDVMSGILSEEFNEHDRAKLVKLYADIICMEQNDLSYINEVVVSSQEDMEIYEMLKKINRVKQLQM